VKCDGNYPVKTEHACGCFIKAVPCIYLFILELVLVAVVASVLRT